MIRIARWARRAAIASVAVATVMLQPHMAFAQQDAFASLLAAEAAFAADAMREGITPAFRAHAAQDSVLLTPEPVPATEYLAKQQDTPGLTLEWRPRLAGVARSGDLGFTSGPYRMALGSRVTTGEFLTIWSRGADGRWRWFLDHGLPPQASADRSLPSVTSVQRFAFGDLPPQEGAGVDELEDVERALNRAYLDRGLSGLLPTLAADGYLLRPGRGPLGKSEASVLASDAQRFTGVDRLGTRISADGALAVSYGRLLPESGAPANYVRIWRRDRGGWELLIDELT
ncbi:nuclear transport factor 2 family protein [Sphingomonas sp. ST-64]|uniref:Nuclear transport factor 2 family protein n=1 Tax=Sphingomonas plantiphila TaxID=3163295 RepID=A0ABW8YNS9_9SPHN